MAVSFAATAAGMRKVALVWKSNSRHATNELRSVPFAQIAPLFQMDDIAWFRLQKDPGPDLAAVHAFDRLTD